MNTTQWKHWQQMKKEQQRQRAQQNSILRAHGYRWVKFAGSAEDDAFGGTYDEWTLYDPTGAPTTVAKALKEIEAKDVAEKTAKVEREATCFSCRSGNHQYCTDKCNKTRDGQPTHDCQCPECHQPMPSGHALLAAQPEVQVATVEVPVVVAIVTLEDGRFEVWVGGVIRQQTYAHRSSARRWIRKHVAC